MPSDYSPMITKLISEGHYKYEEEVVAEGLRLISQREQLRREVQAGINQLDAGDRILAAEALETVRSRLAAKSNSPEG